MKNLEQFTGLYSQSKTLRFELKPREKTQELLSENGFLNRDEQRAEDYKKMKKTIDQYHKYFIHDCLSNLMHESEKFTEMIEEFSQLYYMPLDKRNEKYGDNLEKVKVKLRKEICGYFKKNEKYKLLNKKELIRDELKPWIAGLNEDLFFSDDFNNFTTYFTGYNSNRMNLYSEEGKSTAIVYRLIDENLPKYLDNYRIWYRIDDTFVQKEMNKIAKELLGQNIELDEFLSDKNYICTLTQKNIDQYNLLIGGIKEEKKQISGLNGFINEFNQKHPEHKIPKFKMLYKQLLSDREEISWIDSKYENASELLEDVGSFAERYFGSNAIIDDIVSSYKLLKDANMQKIYVQKGLSVSSLSNAIFSDYSVLSRALECWYINVVDKDYFAKLGKAGNNEKKQKKLEDEKKNYLSGKGYFSLDEIQKALDYYITTIELEQFDTINQNYSNNCIVNHFIRNIESDELYKNIKTKYEDVKDILFIEKKDNSFSKDEKATIKAFMDAILELLHFMKLLYIKPDFSEEKDDLFYGNFLTLYEDYQNCVKIYDRVRNYMTRKPYSDEKIKLNFDCSTLMDGWDVNKESANLCSILLKDGKYYLAILDKNNKKIFETCPSTDEGDCYKKMRYKLLPGPNKELPGMFFRGEKLKQLNPSKEIIEIKKNESFKKGENFKIHDCHKLIEYYKEALYKYTEFEYNFSPTQNYKNINEFYKEVE